MFGLQEVVTDVGIEGVNALINIVQLAILIAILKWVKSE
jgi:hypothetical protein